jgi:hypothetical protein
MLSNYHLFAHSRSADSLEAIRILEKNGLKYVLIFVDKSPDYSRYLMSKHKFDKFPVVLKFLGNMFDVPVVYRGLQEFEEHIREMVS